MAVPVCRWQYAPPGLLSTISRKLRNGSDANHPLSTYSTENFMTLDTQTCVMEIFRNSRSGSVGGSLLSVIDLTRTQSAQVTQKVAWAAIIGYKRTG